MNFPFTEQQINTQLFIREFSADVDEMELIWHTDREDRVVSVIEGNNWKFRGFRRKLVCYHSPMADRYKYTQCFYDL